MQKHYMLSTKLLLRLEANNWSIIAISFFLIAVVLKFKPEPINKNLELDEQGKLACNAEGPTTPTVEWFKMDGDTPRNVTDSHIQTGNGSLIFKPAKKSDAGTYMCKASAGSEVITKSVKVDVYGKDMFTSFHSDTCNRYFHLPPASHNLIIYTRVLNLANLWLKSGLLAILVSSFIHFKLHKNTKGNCVHLALKTSIFELSLALTLIYVLFIKVSLISLVDMLPKVDIYTDVFLLGQHNLS